MTHEILLADEGDIRIRIAGTGWVTINQDVGIQPLITIPADRLDAVIAALMTVRSELGLDDAGRGRRPTDADQKRIVDVATKIRAGDLTIRAISEHRMPQGAYETIFLAERGKQPVVANIMLPVDEARQGIHDGQFTETGPAAETKFDG